MFFSQSFGTVPIASTLRRKFMEFRRIYCNLRIAKIQFGTAGWKIINLQSKYKNGTDGFCAIPIGTNGKFNRPYAVLVRQRNRVEIAPLITIRALALVDGCTSGPIQVLLCTFPNVYCFPHTFNQLKVPGRDTETNLRLERFLHVKEYRALCIQYSEG